jgi:hypothetical protein
MAVNLLAMPTSNHVDNNESAPEYSELLVERCVQRETHRQVDELGVSCRDGRVVVSGLCRSYYVKQLATRAVQSLFPNAAVENLIRVQMGF